MRPGRVAAELRPKPLRRHEAIAFRQFGKTNDDHGSLPMDSGTQSAGVRSTVQPVQGRR